VIELQKIRGTNVNGLSLSVSGSGSGKGTNDDGHAGQPDNGAPGQHTNILSTPICLSPRKVKLGTPPPTLPVVPASSGKAASVFNVYTGEPDHN
jgi:hypothetical protein